MKKKTISARNIAMFAVLVALIIVLQLFASGIKIAGIPINFTLVPIVLGAILLGPLYGAALGVICGLIIFIVGAVGTDMFTFILISDHPILTFFLCILKTGVAGLVAGLLYDVIARKNSVVATFVAAGLVPVINTGIFIIGALMMSGTLKANFVQDGQTVLYFLVIGCAGVNFLVEFAINLIFAPAIASVVKIVEKRAF